MIARSLSIRFCCRCCSVWVVVGTDCSVCQSDEEDPVCKLPDIKKDCEAKCKETMAEYKVSPSLPVSSPSAHPLKAAAVASCSHLE